MSEDLFGRWGILHSSDVVAHFDVGFPRVELFVHPRKHRETLEHVLHCLVLLLTEEAFVLCFFDDMNRLLLAQFSLLLGNDFCFSLVLFSIFATNTLATVARFIFTTICSVRL